MEPTWQILPDDISPDVYTSRAQPIASESNRAGGPLFGHGVLRPFRLDGTGDVASGEGAQLVRAAVGLVLGTTCNSQSTLGELPWRPEFGSLLQQLRLRNNDPKLASIANRLVALAIGRWVPAVSVTEVSIVRVEYTLYVKVTYDVRDLTGTRVLVPGLQTAVAIG